MKVKKPKNLTFQVF